MGVLSYRLISVCSSDVHLAMGIKIEPDSKKTLATAVFEQLRDKIVHGDMDAGETLPSERRSH